MTVMENYKIFHLFYSAILYYAVETLYYAVNTFLPRIKVCVLTFIYITQIIFFSICITALVIIKRINFTSAANA